MTDKELEDLVLTHAQQLGEQFDSVLVMVSWQDGTKTRCLKKRSGNWHAALGMAHEFVSEAQAFDVGCEVAAKIEPPEPPEEWKKA